MIKILIIDDSEIIRSLLSEFFEETGYAVACAIDGLEGIQKALADDYDLIFCDVHMPKRNGYQVFKEVIEHKPEAKFIMTDSLPDSLAEKTLKAGASTILTKPFDLDEVRLTVTRLLEDKQENATQ